MESYFPLLLFISLGIATLSLILNIIAFIQLKKIRTFYNNFFRTSQEANLEKIILDISQKSNKLDNDIEDLYKISNQINKLSLKGISKVGLTRFNPFGGKGHRDCFAVALINNKKRGLVFSTLTTESGTRIFLKQVTNGSADIPLSKEEEAAVKLAK